MFAIWSVTKSVVYQTFLPNVTLYYLASGRVFLKSGLHYFTINRAYYEIGLYCEAKIQINPLFPLLQIESIFAPFVLSIGVILLQMQPFLPQCIPHTYLWCRLSFLLQCNKLLQSLCSFLPIDWRSLWCQHEASLLGPQSFSLWHTPACKGVAGWRQRFMKYL